MASKFSDIRIEQEDLRTSRLFIDGKELNGIQYIQYRIGTDDVPVITVEFIPKTLNINKSLVSKINIDEDEIVETVIKELNKKMKCKGVNL